MTGTVLALATGFFAALALGSVLFALQRPKVPSKAPKTAPRLETDSVTRDEIDARFKDYEQRTEWLLNEWYEKFNTLHARLAKRASRAAAPPPPPGDPEPDGQLSVLNFRRLGSP